MKRILHILLSTAWGAVCAMLLLVLINDFFISLGDISVWLARFVALYRSSVELPIPQWSYFALLLALVSVSGTISVAHLLKFKQNRRLTRVPSLKRMPHVTNLRGKLAKLTSLAIVFLAYYYENWGQYIPSTFGVFQVGIFLRSFLNFSSPWVSLLVSSTPMWFLFFLKFASPVWVGALFGIVSGTKGRKVRMATHLAKKPSERLERWDGTGGPILDDGLPAQWYRFIPVPSSREIRDRLVFAAKSGKAGRLSGWWSSNATWRDACFYYCGVSLTIVLTMFTRFLIQ